MKQWMVDHLGPIMLPVMIIKEDHVGHSVAEEKVPYASTEALEQRVFEGTDASWMVRTQAWERQGKEGRGSIWSKENGHLWSQPKGGKGEGKGSEGAGGKGQNGGCWNCGSASHTWAQCTEKNGGVDAGGVWCWGCGGPHKQRDCPKKQWRGGW